MLDVSAPQDMQEIQLENVLKLISAQMFNVVQTSTLMNVVPTGVKTLVKILSCRTFADQFALQAVSVMKDTSKIQMETVFSQKNVQTLNVVKTSIMKFVGLMDAKILVNNQILSQCAEIFVAKKVATATKVTSERQTENAFFQKTAHRLAI
jgi:hypothetical protein